MAFILQFHHGHFRRRNDNHRRRGASGGEGRVLRACFPVKSIRIREEWKASCEERLSLADEEALTVYNEMEFIRVGSILGRRTKDDS